MRRTSLKVKPSPTIQPPPTFENTIVAMEKSGQLINRVMLVFNGVSGANMNPVLQKIQDEVAPKLAAMQDAILLNSKLFARVEKIYESGTLSSSIPKPLRLVEYDYQQFVLAGATALRRRQSRTEKAQ